MKLFLLLILSSPQERPVLELECGSVPVLVGNEISAAESQNFPLNDLICLPQNKKAFHACFLLASESSRAVNLMKYKSLQKKTWKLLLCFQLLKQNTSYRITVLRKKKLHIIIYASGQKNFPCLKFYFFFPGNGKDLKTSLNQKKTTTKKDRTCILSRCSDTNFMQTGNLFFCGAEIRKQKCFWATRDNRKWKYLFFLSIYLQANKFVFTKCLYSYHETRFAWKFGQNHCPRIKQSLLPVECVAQFNSRFCSRFCFSSPLWRPKRNQS